MKQHINFKDAQQLSSENWKKLIKWKMKCEDVRGDLPVWWEMTIGEMIEFLNEHEDLEEEPDFKFITWYAPHELCDDLFERVKKILEKE